MALSVRPLSQAGPDWTLDRNAGYGLLELPNPNTKSLLFDAQISGRHDRTDAPWLKKYNIPLAIRGHSRDELKAIPNMPPELTA
jgi:hypothetical protein